MCATTTADGEGTGPETCLVALGVYYALDGGVLTVQVEIIDVNDSPPRYSYVKLKLCQ